MSKILLSIAIIMTFTVNCWGSDFNYLKDEDLTTAETKLSGVAEGDVTGGEYEPCKYALDTEGKTLEERVEALEAHLLVNLTRECYEIEHRRSVWNRY